AGRDLRTAGTERRREVDDHRNPDDAGAADGGAGVRRRARRMEGAGGGEAVDRSGAAAPEPGLHADGARDPGVPRSVLRAKGQGAEEEGGGAAREIQADGAGGPDGARVLGRDDAAAVDRAGDDARPGGAVPGRAFGGAGSADAAAAVGPGAGLQPA